MFAINQENGILTWFIYHLSIQGFNLYSYITRIEVIISLST